MYLHLYVSTSICIYSTYIYIYLPEHNSTVNSKSQNAMAYFKTARQSSFSIIESKEMI